jgi:hypothetical protein
MQILIALITEATAHFAERKHQFRFVPEDFLAPGSWRVVSRRSGLLQVAFWEASNLSADTIDRKRRAF